MLDIYFDFESSVHLLDLHVELIGISDFANVLQKRNAKKEVSEKKYYEERKYVCGDCKLVRRSML